MQYPQLAEHRFDAVALGAAGSHLATPPQEMPYALINVVHPRQDLRPTVSDLTGAKFRQRLRSTTAGKENATKEPPSGSTDGNHSDPGRHAAARFSGGMQMTHDMHQKVNSIHLKRTAYLYIRQSPLRQVFENTESTKRQYGLRQKALALAGSWRSRRKSGRR
jgi:hypothetical protein